jgi:FHA domain-containing protein
MAVCLQCQLANPDGVSACGRCGARLGDSSKSGIHVPLPAPMSEPIAAPNKPPSDDRPLLGQLRPDSAAETPVPDACPALANDPPARSTLRDPPADVFPTHDATSPGGTVPAHPGLPEHPMNDAVLQAASSRTAPATQPAEEPARPLPVAAVGRPRLIVLRGLKINTEYPIYEGRNTIGRFADKPVDIDLVSQEAVEQIWCSRQHAVITFDRGTVLVEDLNSLNGTWVNGSRIHAGQYHALKHGDVIQIGTVQLKLHLV